MYTNRFIILPVYLGGNTLDKDIRIDPSEILYYHEVYVASSVTWTLIVFKSLHKLTIRLSLEGFEQRLNDFTKSTIE